MRGTEIAYSAILLSGLSAYAMRGTEIAYGARSACKRAVPERPSTGRVGPRSGAPYTAKSHTETHIPGTKCTRSTVRCTGRVEPRSGPTLHCVSGTAHCRAPYAISVLMCLGAAALPRPGAPHM
eukprot:2515885-Rhodomonas_salina.4